jgi:DNA-binding transcriptional MerR regulator
MKIGQAAIAGGVTVKAIRHYEAIGLLKDLKRSGSYRELSPQDVERLRTIARCRSLGFSLPETRRVLSLVEEARPACPAPDAMLDVVEAKLGGVHRKIRELQTAAKKLTDTKRYLEARRDERVA